MRAEQPYNQTELYYFTYNIKTRIVEQDQALVQKYSLERYYYNMPYGFSDSNVVEEDRQVYNDMYHRLDEGAKYATAEFRVTSDFHWARVALYQESPDSCVYRGVVQDVSERYRYVIQQVKQREAERNRLMSKELEAIQLLRAISETYDLIISVNLTQNHYYMIDAETYINKEKDEGVFQEVIDCHAMLVSDQHREMYYNTFSRDALIDAYKAGKKSVYLEYQQRGDDGKFHWLATHTMFVENPFSDDIMEITIIRNIDERIRKEQENQLILKDALLLAEKANAAKSDFLSRMSHDIRTPMNAIIGMTTIAAAQIDDKEKVKECLSKIGISSRFLLSLVNDILDLAKIESGKMSISSQPFAMRELTDSLINSATSLTSEKKQFFKCVIDDRLSDTYLGDRLRIEQVIQNLIANASKFTPENGEVSLKVEMAEHTDACDTLRFTVKDTGIGIPDDFIEKLFEPFVQDDAQQNRKGSGLGLAIVKNLLNLMDGAIRVYSVPGNGSTFVVELPVKLCENERDFRSADEILDATVLKAAEATSRQLDNRGTSREIMFHGERILLAEDNEFNQEVAKTILEMHDLNVDIAKDGYEAVEKFNASQPGYYSAVFMDIQMPGIDGFEATRRIRKGSHPEAESIPVFAMTANAFASDVSAAKQHGMNGHIAKPVDFDVVAQILMKLIKNG